MGKVQMKPIRVVIDTNVLVSALLFGGTPGKLIPLWKNARIEPYLSKAILDEVMRVLAYPRFNLSEQEIEYLVYQEILPFFHNVEVQSGPIIIEDDPSDDHFLRCAMAARARHIISGDQHLLSLKKYGNIQIVSPGEFLRSNRPPQA
ncbi:MAG: putative toxin-antitoxin system toxin component, PIN family [Deltaproteobacteria bacterium]|nr:putative toxin-antitoxin system toxin component, PIN family [Deltaproteobacteria bacterium]